MCVNHKLHLMPRCFSSLLTAVFRALDRYSIKSFWCQGFDSIHRVPLTTIMWKKLCNFFLVSLDSAGLPTCWSVIMKPEKVNATISVTAFNSLQPWRPKRLAQIVYNESMEAKIYKKRECQEVRYLTPTLETH